MNKKEKRIKVHYLWGDQEACFYYAYRLAQEEFSIKKHRVYKTCANQEEIMENYSNEECLMLLGLCADDIPTPELVALLEGRYCNDADLSNLKTIIITAHCEPVDFEYEIEADGDEFDYWDFLRAIDYEYNVSNTEERGVASVSMIIKDGDEYDVVEKERFHIYGEPIISESGCFEKFDFEQFFLTINDETMEFIDKAKRLSVIDQRKLCAACELRYIKDLSVKEANKCIDELECYDFRPDILTFKDVGYMCVYENEMFDVPCDMRSYFNFDKLGYAALFRRNGIGLTKYGLIQFVMSAKKLEEYQQELTKKCRSNNKENSNEADMKSSELITDQEVLDMISNLDDENLPF